jgi:octaprenyl-diphosphate synthase
VLAFRRGNDEERAFWRRVMEELDQKDGDLERAQALMARHNALKDTVERARHYGSIARDSLGLFADGPIKQALLEVIDFVIDRDF